MASKRVKIHGETEDNKEPATISEDRISDLPDAIIHLIFAYLPTIVAVRMGILSKRWRHVWNSIPVLDFCDSREVEYFRRPDQERNAERKRFFKFVDECLRHLYAGTTITKFKLKMDFFGAGSRVDNWLRFPVTKHVKELDLCVQARRYVNYRLPHSILGLSTLTSLKLNGLDLEVLSPINLPSLEVLHLVDIQMDDVALLYFMVACPSLANLRLVGCSGLLNPYVMSLTLKTLEFRTGGRFFHNQIHCQTIKVHTAKLESFIYDGRHGGREFNINLIPCETIRNLSFTYACLSDQWLNHLIPRLPLLESLKLENCSGLKHFRIRNRRLRDLVFTSDFRGFDSLEAEAKIETPSLVSFRYAGHSMIKISLSAPNLLDVNIGVHSYPEKTYGVEWYSNLIKFLSELYGAKKVDIFCCSEKALIIPDELRKVYPSPLPDLEDLKVETFRPLYRKAMLRKSLAWISPSVKKLSIEH